MSSITLRLVNRSPRQPIKKLPESVEIPQDATAEDVKKIIARKAGVSDFNRIGLFDPATKKTIKDRNALIRSQDAVMSAGELLVKDLGLQMSWRLVFVIEYFGPILFHALVVALRPHIYRFSPYVYKNETETPMTTVQWLVFALFQLHFIKRELETMFLHKFSSNTMPAWNIFRNSAFYWLPGGLLAALHIYAPGSISARDKLGLLDYVCLAVWVNAEIGNYLVHRHLASLRRPGGTERGIPHCIGSDLVTCPNYMFEVIAWVAVILICRSFMVVIFISIGILYMRSWSKGKEKALRQQFGRRYKMKRYTMLPGLI